MDFFQVASDSHLTGSTDPLFPLESEFRDPQARGVVAHYALDIVGKAVGGLGIDIERHADLCAADPIQLAQDRLGDIADLWRRSVRVENYLGIEAAGPALLGCWRWRWRVYRRPTAAAAGRFGLAWRFLSEPGWKSTLAWPDRVQPMSLTVSAVTRSR
jgi:hypothetical protein